MQWTITLTEPDIGEEEIEAVVQVLRSKWLTAGEVTARFEREFARKIGVRHAIAVSSCTAALHLTYIALGIGSGDEVICPSLTFVATANAVKYTGADVVFAGPTSSDDLTISVAEIRRKISPRTKAIAVMHYGGFPCEMTEIMQIAHDHRLAVVEDCAHSPFASLPDGQGGQRYTGSIGDVGCFSFFGNKNMTTGEGGMVTTDSDELAGRIRLLRSHGMTTASYDRHRGHASQYDVVELGYNYRLDEIRSAIGLCQLAKIDSLNAERRRVYASYRAELAGGPVLVPFSKRNLAESACHILTVLVPDTLIVPMKEALQLQGIQTSRHYELIPSFTLYGGGGDHSSPFREYGLLTLPLGPRMTADQVRLVTRAIQGVTACAA